MGILEKIRGYLTFYTFLYILCTSNNNDIITITGFGLFCRSIVFVVTNLLLHTCFASFALLPFAPSVDD